MRIIYIFFGIIITFSLSAQDKWNVNNPPGDFKEHEFTFTEGTWMNLDVSPLRLQTVDNMIRRRWMR